MRVFHQENLKQTMTHIYNSLSHKLSLHKVW